MIILYLISQQEGLGFESKPIYVQQLACSPLVCMSSLRYSGFLPEYKDMQMFGWLPILN